MSEIQFFQTRMGAKFFEGTMPEIAEQLERLNANLEALLIALREPGETPPNEGSQQQLEHPTSKPPLG